jgi:hypothetical protein
VNRVIGDVLTSGELDTPMEIPRSTLYKLVSENGTLSQKSDSHWCIPKTPIDDCLEGVRAIEHSSGRDL